MIIDAHVHVASRDEARFPRDLRGVGSAWWTDPVDGPGLIGVMDAYGIDRCVAVQAVGVYGYDNSYLLEACSRFPQRLVAIPAADTESEVLRLVAEPLVVGIRCFLVGGIGSGLVEAALRNAPSVVLTGWLDQLMPMFDLLAEFRDVPTVIDHCGFPDWSSSADWTKLARLAEQSQVCVKFTGHLLHGSPGAARNFDRVTALFGARRVIAGSDFPQTSRDYDATWSQLRGLAGATAAEDFLGLNAERIWFAR